MAIDPEWATLISVVGGIGGYIVREILKGKTEKKNNGHIEVVKGTVEAVNGKIDNLDLKVDGIDRKVEGIDTKIEERKGVCETTVKRFENNFKMINKELMDRAKK